MVTRVKINPATSRRGERMSKVDTAWLRMDTQHNLMMIVGIWVLKPGISHDAVCARIEERLLKYRRFGQRVVEDAAGATWVDDENFDIRRQVVVEQLPKTPRGQAERTDQANCWGPCATRY